MKKMFYSAVAACTLTVSAFGQNAVDKSTLSPVEAVKTMAVDMMDGNATSLWDCLPKNYQTDSEAMIQALGKKMDPAVYNEVLKTLTQLNGLLKAKKDIILEMAEDKVPAGDVEGNKKFNGLKENYTEVTGFLDALLNSDIKNVEGLKAFDVAKFCKAIEPGF